MNRSLRTDRDNVRSTTDAKEARLGERIGELERDNAELHEQISIAEGEKARLVKRPYTSQAFEFLAIPREQYEEWILVEVLVKVVRELV